MIAHTGTATTAPTATNAIAAKAAELRRNPLARIQATAASATPAITRAANGISITTKVAGTYTHGMKTNAAPASTNTADGRVR